MSNVIDIVIDAVTDAAEHELESFGKKAAKSGLEAGEGFSKGLGDGVQDGGKRAKRSLDDVAGATDEVASQSSKLTGAFGALAGGAEAVGLGPYAAGLQVAAIASDSLSGISDLATLAIEKLRLKQIGAAIATAATTVAQKVAAGATKAWTLAQAALNLVMSANPIVLIALAIGALIAVIVIIATKTTWFQDLWSAAWDAIKSAASAVWDFLKQIFDLWMLQWELLWKAAVKAKDLLLGAFDAVKDGISAAASWVGDRVNDIVNFFTSLPGKVTSAVSGAFDGLKDAFLGALRWIQNAWNALHVHVPGIDTHIPGVGTIGDFDFGLPQVHIPGLKDGGIVRARSGGTLVNAGEGGEDEVIAPLSKLPSAAPASMTIQFSGNTDTAFATLFMKLVRTGVIQIQTS